MEESMFPPRVTQGEDGVYRWSYEMDMYRNHYLRNVLLKIMGVICAVGWAFLMFLFFYHSHITAEVVVYGLLVFGGPVLLTLGGYYLAALIMKGRYRVRFEMNEEAILLVRSEAVKNMMEGMALITLFAGRAAGRPRQAMGQSNAIMAGSVSGYTPFRDVRGIKVRREYDAFNLRTLYGGNQIWVGPEDYDFVLEYVSSRCPERARP